MMRKLFFLLTAALLFQGCAAGPAKQAAPIAESAAPLLAEKIETPAPPPPVPAEIETPPSRGPAPVTIKKAAPLSRPAPAAVGEDPFPGSDGEEQYVSLNFDNADITVVIQTIAELIELNYILAPGVRGRVTIQSSEKIPFSSLFAVLGEILEVNSLTAIKSGNFYKIVPTNQARQKEIETIVDQEELPPGNRVVTKVSPLKHIRPSEVIKVLNPLKSPAGLYQAHDPTQLLFLTDTANKIEQLMRIVSILDVDTFARIQVELYPVKYANVEDLAKELTQVVTMVLSATGKGRALFKIIPVSQISSLLIISGEQGLAENIHSWISKLDQPGSGVTEQIFVYPLSHAKAEEIATVLNQVFKKEAKKTVRAASTAPAPAAARTAPTQGRNVPVTARAPMVRTTTTSQSSSVDASTASPVTIVADKATNSLVIQTASWYFPVVEEIIRKLDVMPKQVLIEVLIAEITLDDQTQFGLQWALRGQGSANVLGESHNFESSFQNVFPPDGLSGVTVAGTGFSFLVTEANRVTAALNAYASSAKLNVLSSPHILATDNKEAKIDVGAEIPILRTRTTETAGTSSSTNSGTVTNDIEYRDTGIILTVTPHINESRYVTLDIKQEVSEAQTNTISGTDSPIIRKRTAQTTMVVKDRETLVIGGMIEEKRDKSREGLPFLSRIPVLGYLFGATVEKFSKTELVLLLTPRVIGSPEDGRRVSGDIRDRVLTLKEGIEHFQKGAAPQE